jgi:hypothetical protein
MVEMAMLIPLAEHVMTSSQRAVAPSGGPKL